MKKLCVDKQFVNGTELDCIHQSNKQTDITHFHSISGDHGDNVIEIVQFLFLILLCKFILQLPINLPSFLLPLKF